MAMRPHGADEFASCYVGALVRLLEDTERRLIDDGATPSMRAALSTMRRDLQWLLGNDQ